MHAWLNDERWKFSVQTNWIIRWIKDLLLFTTDGCLFCTLVVRVHDYLIILYGRIFSFHKTGISAEEINGYQLIKFKQKLLWEIVSSLPIFKKKKHILSFLRYYIRSSFRLWDLLSLGINKNLAMSFKKYRPLKFKFSN